MAHSALNPVFVGLRTGLHLLFVALIGLVIVRATLEQSTVNAAVTPLALVLLATYIVGGILGQRIATKHPAVLIWLFIISVECVALLWLIADAAYLVFPLFFLYLHLLGRRTGPLAVLGITVMAIVALGVHNGWSIGGVIGPLVGACVAVMIGLGYQAITREAEQREKLMAELIATRDQLVASEHEAGVLAERSRLAREIHDTVAQGLSSIQLLLHAAERADPEHAGIEHIRLARETAAANLADTRRFIRELTPPNFDDEGLGGALRRLAATQWEPTGITVNVRIAERPSLPMHLQTAFLRIAQGAMANVIQHAQAMTATITLTSDQNHLRFSIADDGLGFDPSELRGPGDDSEGSLSPGIPPERTDSFGLLATQERVDQLGGTLTIDSAPGRGTVVQVDLAIEDHK